MFPFAAVLAAIAVILGAMGAHGPVAESLKATGMLENWKTASHYHLVHAVALVALAQGVIACRRARIGWWLLVVGVFLFSGSLYVLSATGVKWLGAITPLGGLSLISGWLLLALSKRS